MALREDGPAYGAHLASRFGLEKQQSHVTRAFRRGVLAVTQIESGIPTPAPTQSIGFDEAWLVGLQLRDVPDHELWQDGRPLKVETFDNRDTTFYDLRRNPVALVRRPYHCLQFYLPRSVLAETAQQNGVRFHGELNAHTGMKRRDPVMRALGEAILPTLARGYATDGLFIDHILQAAALHVVGRYGNCGPAAPRNVGGLAPWQERRAKEMMEAGLAGDVTLNALAQACGLSVAHFARAFRQSSGTSPHRWLRRQRVEKAMDMMARTTLSLAAIATACGFSDQSHFTRSFTALAGTSPGQWRRAMRF